MNTFEELVHAIEITTGLPRVDKKDGYLDIEAHFRADERILRVAEIPGGHSMTVFTLGLYASGTITFANIPDLFIARTAHAMLTGDYLLEP